jgi:hypothetical protein
VTVAVSARMVTAKAAHIVTAKAAHMVIAKAALVTAKAAEAEGNCEDNSVADGVSDSSAARSCRISRCSPSILSITLFNWDDFFLHDFCVDPPQLAPPRLRLLPFYCCHLHHEISFALLRYIS